MEFHWHIDLTLISIQLCCVHISDCFTILLTNGIYYIQFHIEKYLKGFFSFQRMFIKVDYIHIWIRIFSDNIHIIFSHAHTIDSEYFQGTRYSSDLWLMLHFLWTSLSCWTGLECSVAQGIVHNTYEISILKVKISVIVTMTTINSFFHRDYNKHKQSW